MAGQIQCFISPLVLGNIFRNTHQVGRVSLFIRNWNFLGMKDPFSPEPGLDLLIGDVNGRSLLKDVPVIFF